jgi:hypothetical protein
MFIYIKTYTLINLYIHTYIYIYIQITKKGHYPTPRCGAVMTVYKNKGIFYHVIIFIILTYLYAYTYTYICTYICIYIYIYIYMYMYIFTYRYIYIYINMNSYIYIYIYTNIGLFFGGVFDDEGPNHCMTSCFYNEMYAFDMSRKKWYQLG